MDLYWFLISRWYLAWKISSFCSPLHFRCTWDSILFISSLHKKGIVIAQPTTPEIPKMERSCQHEKGRRNLKKYYRMRHAIKKQMGEREKRKAAQNWLRKNTRAILTLDRVRVCMLSWPVSEAAVAPVLAHFTKSLHLPKRYCDRWTHFCISEIPKMENFCQYEKECTEPSLLNRIWSGRRRESPRVIMFTNLHDKKPREIFTDDCGRICLHSSKTDVMPMYSGHLYSFSTHPSQAFAFNSGSFIDPIRKP